MLTSVGAVAVAIQERASAAGPPRNAIVLLAESIHISTDRTAPC